MNFKGVADGWDTPSVLGVPPEDRNQSSQRGVAAAGLSWLEGAGDGGFTDGMVEFRSCQQGDADLH